MTFSRRFECSFILFWKSYIYTILFEHGFTRELYILLFAAEVGEPRCTFYWLTIRRFRDTYAFVWIYFRHFNWKRGVWKQRKIQQERRYNFLWLTILIKKRNLWWLKEIPKRKRDGIHHNNQYDGFLFSCFALFDCLHKLILCFVRNEQEL
jgi:hypothetical protein